MNDAPRYGQRAPEARQEMCPKHPNSQAVSYCKRCNRPACADCSIPTEVGSICVDCAGSTPGARSGFLGPRSTGRSPWGRPGASRTRSMYAKPPAPVTTALIGINVVMFLIQQFSDTVTNWLAFNPYFAYTQPWRILTASFLHGGFFHLLFNMMMLYIIGSSVEKALGWWRYLGVYLLSAAGGSMAVIAWVAVRPESLSVWTVGASGALYGMFGAVLMLQKRAGVSTTSILILLAVNLVYGFIVPNVSWQAHLGGFIIGLLATAAFIGAGNLAKGKSQKVMTAWGILTLVGLTAAVALGTWGLYLLIT